MAIINTRAEVPRSLKLSLSLLHLLLVHLYSGASTCGDAFRRG